MPNRLKKLLARLILLLSRYTQSLENETITVTQWYDNMLSALNRFHQAAFLAGSGDKALTTASRRVVIQSVNEQKKYLDNFKTTIQNTDEWQKGWNARAVMYAGSIKEPYWRGSTKLLPLPFMPAQGTQCHTNCGCSWEIVTIDEEAGDYDCYWRRGKNDSCQTCIERENMNPYQIRGGMLL